MPVYHFRSHQGGGPVSDVVDQELGDDAAAILTAKKAAIESLQEFIPQNGDLISVLVTVERGEIKLADVSMTANIKRNA